MGNGGILVLLGFTGRGATWASAGSRWKRAAVRDALAGAGGGSLGGWFLGLPGFTEFDRAGFSEDAGWGHPAYKARFGPRFHVLVLVEPRSGFRPNRGWT